MTRAGSRRRRAWLLGVLLTVAPAHAVAQPEDAPAGPRPDAQQASSQAGGQADGQAPDQTIDQTIDQAVARAVLERAEELFDQGDHANAKVLLGESLARSPRSPHAQEALALLRRCNDALGIADRDHGAPPELVGTAAAEGAPLDPYGGGDDGAPLDPYGDAGGDTTAEATTGTTIDPYGAPPATGADGGPAAAGSGEEAVGFAAEAKEDDLASGRHTLLVHGGLLGFVTGMALGGGDGDGAVALGLVGTGAGLGGGYLYARHRDISAGQASAMAWSSAWVGTTFGLMTDLVTGIDSTSTGEAFAGVALGSLVGTGAGWLVAHKLDPSAGDVAEVSSLGLYGTVGGLLVGAGLNPAESEAYSLNALVGATLGLGVGMYVAPRVEASRRRMLWVDLGAAAGAAVPWVVLYPLLAGEEEDTGLQVAGWLSTLGLFGGAYMAWRWTAGMDEEPLRIGRKQIATVPALIQRSEDGRWDLGVPAVRTAAMPRLAPEGARGLAIDILGGHF